MRKNTAGIIGYSRCFRNGLILTQPTNDCQMGYEIWKNECFKAGWHEACLLKKHWFTETMYFGHQNDLIK